jgi:hypothetical protein
LNSTSAPIIENFIYSVVQSHELATGLKQLTSHEQIIDYAYSKGFSFAKADWDEFIHSDTESLISQDKQTALFYDTNHWSWAFRQVSSWRAMLMEGADHGSSLKSST